MGKLRESFKRMSRPGSKEASVQDLSNMTPEEKIKYELSAAYQGIEYSNQQVANNAVYVDPQGNVLSVMAMIQYAGEPKFRNKSLDDITLKEKDDLFSRCMRKIKKVFSGTEERDLESEDTVSLDETHDSEIEIDGERVRGAVALKRKPDLVREEEMPPLEDVTDREEHASLGAIPKIPILRKNERKEKPRIPSPVFTPNANYTPSAPPMQKGELERSKASGGMSQLEKELQEMKEQVKSLQLERDEAQSRARKLKREADRARREVERERGQERAGSQSEHEMREGMKRESAFDSERARILRERIARRHRDRSRHRVYSYDSSDTDASNVSFASAQSRVSRSFRQEGGSETEARSDRERPREREPVRRDARVSDSHDGQFVRRSELDSYLQSYVSRNSFRSGENTVDYGINLSRINQVRESYVAKKISMLRKAKLYDLRIGGNFYKWLAQFPVNNYPRFSQKEYNCLLNGFLSVEMTEILQKQGVSPREMNSDEFLKEVQQVCCNNIYSVRDIENQLRKLSPKSMSAMEYLQAILSLVDVVHHSQWAEGHKKELILDTFTRAFSGPIQIQITQYCRTQSTNLLGFVESIKSFVRQYHEVLINDMTGKSGQRRVNEVQLAETDGEANDRSPPSKTSSKNQGGGKNNGKPQNKNKNKNRFSKPISTDLSCATCSSYGHKSQSCIYHPDRLKAHENQQRVGYGYCLLCHGEDHMAFNCPTLKDCTATAEACANCKRLGFYRFHHAEQDCFRSKN